MLQATGHMPYYRPWAELQARGHAHGPRCDFEVWISLLANEVGYLYDLVTACPGESSSSGGLHCHAAVAIMDGTVEADRHKYHWDGSYSEETPGATPDNMGVYTVLKTEREGEFPSAQLEKALAVDVREGDASIPSDRTHILSAMAGLPAPKHSANEPCNCAEPPAEHEAFEAVNRSLRGRVAASALRRAVEAGGEMLGRYLEALDGSRLRRLSINFGGRSGWDDDTCKELTAQVVARLINALPSTLMELALMGMHRITELPTAIGKFAFLTSFNLSKCYELKTLPESIGALTSLTLLDLSECSQLDGLPQSISELNALNSLNLQCCYKLQTIPESMSLQALISLNLSNCWELEGLPASVSEMKALTLLDLHDCRKLKTLPDSLYELTALTSLELSKCLQLEGLPVSISELKALTLFNVHDCPELKQLPDLSMLPNLACMHEYHVSMYQHAYCCLQRLPTCESFRTTCVSCLAAAIAFAPPAAGNENKPQ